MAMGVILLDLLRKHAARSPNAACLSFEAETLTYRELDDRSSRVANALLERRLRPGDRVAIIARNAPVHFELLFGCAKIGAIMLPINWRLSPSEVAAILADADPTVLLVSEELRFLLSEMQSQHDPIDLNRAYSAWRDAASSFDPDRPNAAHDATLILYTSGTTGVPKGATISHENLSYTERMAREMWGFTAGSVNLVAMPLYHIGGIGYAMMALSQGGHTVLLQQPVPDLVIDAIRRHSVTHVFIVPAVLQMLVDVPGVEEMNLASLQRIIYGAAPISEMLLRRAIAVFGCALDHAYGMTETAGTVVTLAPRDHDPGGPRAHRLRSCGLPLSWVELALVDPATGDPVPTGEVGEICIRSRMNMLGYWRKPAETAATITSDGWLRTGDAAHQDADGYVYIRDRYKDMIVSGGENIYPTEIENVLCHHPDVAEVSVIGVPHDRWGETPKAIVVLRPGRQVSGTDLIAFARRSLAHYKCPTLVEFATALPRSAAGKVLKRELRALEAAKHAVSE